MPLNPAANTFDPVNALVLAGASRVAYRDEAAARAWAIENGFSKDAFEWLDFKSETGLLEDLQAFTTSNADAVILAFRGSASPKDWMNDFRAVPVRFDWVFSGAPHVGEIHAGFSHEFLGGMEKIVEAVERVAPRPALTAADSTSSQAQRTLWITGHSLGGALAVVAAAVFSIFGGRTRSGLSIMRPVSGVYTFGQPRVGLHNFSDYYDRLLRSRTFRFVNNRDLVPRVPFRGWDYADSGHMIHFDASGVARVQSTEWRGFLSRTIETFAEANEIFTHLGGDAGDHSMDLYFERVKANQLRLAGEILVDLS